MKGRKPTGVLWDKENLSNLNKGFYRIIATPTIVSAARSGLGSADGRDKPVKAKD